MPASNDQLYKYHVTNNRSVEIALKNTSIAARKAISEENHSATKSFVSLYAFLLGAWAENRLRKLLYENLGLSDQERDLITAQSSQIDKWVKLIEVAFRKHYLIPAADLNNDNLPFAAETKYIALSEILEQDLKIVIEMRNRLAHGQWVYPLNSDESDIEQGKYQALNQENIAALQYKKSLITSDCGSKSTFLSHSFIPHCFCFYHHIEDRNHLSHTSYNGYFLWLPLCYEALIITFESWI